MGPTVCQSQAFFMWSLIYPHLKGEATTGSRTRDPGLSVHAPPWAPATSAPWLQKEYTALSLVMDSSLLTDFLH